MKSWIVLLVLVTLTTYCSGRTRFRMIEYDESEEKTTAYKQCMIKCKHACLEDTNYCKKKYGDAETLCRNGSEDDHRLQWPGFVYNGKLLKMCQPIISPKIIEPKPQHPFNTYELWRLFDTN